MDTRHFASVGRKWAPWIVLAGVLILSICQLRYQGRVWSCSCGRWYPWAGDIWSRHNSQHLFDPYSFTHMLHGLVLFGLVSVLVPRLSQVWRFTTAIALEALWEVFENSDFVIQRYRDATLAIGYQGDAIINSMGDILFCAAGIMLARYLGWRRSVVLFIVTDLVLLIWIRDSLILNIVMLIHPLGAIKAWQISQ